MLAIKDKLIGSSFWKDPGLLKKIYGAFNEAVQTDMNWSEKIVFAKFFLNLPDGAIRHLVLDTGNEEQKRKGFLINPPASQYKGAWVLIPRSGDFSEIQKYIACQLETPNCEMGP